MTNEALITFLAQEVAGATMLSQKSHILFLSLLICFPSALRLICTVCLLFLHICFLLYIISQINPNMFRIILGTQEE